MNQKEVPDTDRPVVSFCIATFQRYEMLEELIREILSVQIKNIEVAVCDDRSLDGSMEKIKEIKDDRLKIYVNEENVGSSLNIHDSLDRGKGRYLFYVNDRDNVDSFKIKKLVEILEKLEKEDVAFAKCSEMHSSVREFQVINEGNEAMLQFACKVDHPTGYIFKRDIWKKIKNKRVLFENQNYGDFPITQVCAIMAKKHKGAWIYGDICDVKRRRTDFSKVKSGYYLKRTDKRLWYTPEILFKELQIGQKFLKQIGVQKDIIEQLLMNRYALYLSWCMTNYKDMIADPLNTVHYNFYPHQDFFHVFIISITNGVKLWNKMLFLCDGKKKSLVSNINKISRREYSHYLKQVLEDYLYVKGKTARKLDEKDYEIAKREAALNTYEGWVNTLINQKKISEYLLENGYRHVAIYGMGRIGKHLWNEFHTSEIRVDFVIDQKISKEIPYYKGIPCFDMGSDFPDTDLIIVTVSGERDMIIDQLRKKVRCAIKSISDILFCVG